MRQRILIISIAAAALLILMTVAIFSAVAPRKITLKANPDISKVTVNGTQMDFKQDMKIDYEEATTLEVTKDGYDAFKVTLEPTKDTIKEYTITLTKKSNAPVGSTNYDLLTAAEKEDNNGLIADDGNALNVAVKDTKKFSAGYTLYTVAPLDGNGDAALVITKNDYIILGPGTNFAQTDLIGLPDDLTNYLQGIGVGGAE